MGSTNGKRGFTSDDMRRVAEAMRASLDAGKRDVDMVNDVRARLANQARNGK
jgi:hypothetical protein